MTMMNRNVVGSNGRRYDVKDMGLNTVLGIIVNLMYIK